MMSESKFYVYQLSVEGEGQPFYVGKGQGYRAYKHLKGNDGNPKSFKNTKIKKAIREGKEILVQFLKTDLSSDDAAMWEVFYIAEYGRRDLGYGPLTNGTDGGEGVAGYRHTDEQKAHHSAVMKGRKIDNGRLGKKHSIETRDKIAIGNKGKIVSDETRAKLSLAHKGKPQPVVECPHCGKSGGARAMKQYHFDNCKHKG